MTKKRYIDSMSCSHLLLSACSHTSPNKETEIATMSKLSPSASALPQPPSKRKHVSPTATFCLLVGLSPTASQFFKQPIAIGNCDRIMPRYQHFYECVQVHNSFTSHAGVNMQLRPQTRCINKRNTHGRVEHKVRKHVFPIDSLILLFSIKYFLTNP